MMVDARVKGLNGGRKQHWLRIHRAEVMDYYEACGEEATRERFNIRNNTAWLNFLIPPAVHATRLTDSSRAILRAEIAEEALRDLRGEIRELKLQYIQFVNLVGRQLAEEFFIPLIQAKIELPPELENRPADPLDLEEWEALDDFEGKS